MDVGINYYLKKMGLSGETKHYQLDSRLIKSYDEPDQADVRQFLEYNAMGVCSISDLYELPNNLKQASLLFSHDYFRIEKSMNFIIKNLDFNENKTIFDLGCGFGLLLNYLINFTDARFDLHGIDKSTSLINIGKELTSLPLIEGDYLTYKPTKKSDILICEFGFDTEDLEIDEKPHTFKLIDDVNGYCPSCVEEFDKKIEKYLKSWRSWSKTDGQLIMISRLNFNSNLIYSFIKQAAEVGWYPIHDKTEWVKVIDPRRSPKQEELFLGMVLDNRNDKDIDYLYSEIINQLRNS